MSYFIYFSSIYVDPHPQNPVNFPRHQQANDTNDVSLWHCGLGTELFAHEGLCCSNGFCKSSNVLKHKCRAVQGEVWQHVSKHMQPTSLFNNLSDLSAFLCCRIGGNKGCNHLNLLLIGDLFLSRTNMEKPHGCIEWQHRLSLPISSAEEWRSLGRSGAHVAKACRKHNYLIYMNWFQSYMKIGSHNPRQLEVNIQQTSESYLEQNNRL